MSFTPTGLDAIAIGRAAHGQQACLHSNRQCWVFARVFFRNLSRSGHEAWAYGGDFGGVDAFAAGKALFDEMPSVYGYLTGYFFDLSA